MRLVAEKLTVRFAGRRILDGLDVALEPGECVGLIGPNGAGKSTLLRALAGMLPFQGAVMLDGRSLAAWSSRERACRVGYLAQGREVAWPIDVAEVVALGRLPHRAPFAQDNEADRAAVAEALRLADIEALAERPADALSGGEVARMLLARLLAQQTPILLADEPAAGLDPAHQLATMQIFADLARTGRGILVSLHDLTLAARWCDRLILMQEGSIVAAGAPEQVLTADRLAAAYGIEARIDRDGDGMIVVPLRLVGHHSAGPVP